MPDNNNQKTLRALVIASSDVDQELYQEQLCSMGIDSCATECLSEAQQLLDVIVEKNICVDLVVLDCDHMSDNAKKDFIVRLRNQANFKNTTILAARDDKIDDNDGFFQQVDEILPKPISPSLFEETIGKLLGNDAAVLEKADEVNPSGFGLDILIAEDNEVNQIVFTEVLNDLGVCFKIASNGHEAVELWKTYNPAIILMDVSMPVMSGHEATNAIRAIERENGLRHTPICAITAHALKGDKDDCFAAGMDDYLSKPVSPDMMARKIASLLPESHSLSGMLEPKKVA